jgi:hypothetical protein
MGVAQMIDSFAARIAQSSKVQSMFSNLVGLRPNMTAAEFDGVAGSVLAGYPGLTRVGLNQFVA